MPGIFILQGSIAMSDTDTARKPRKRADEKLTFGEAAAARRLGVSYSTLLRRRMKGLVPFYRVGSRVLYDDECLAEFLQKSRVA